ncbi:NAD(P)H-binding protein [Pseudoalteromonas obscura]|uniref:Short chain dehydrogenase n=1 Tax=Pseudoalteromonas obscura TaxID=3048491 RepID=A0ABT7EGC2_9GAMM|nr:NAD(P)H-binding protein [Pseudoalteromonas sp. P94(2023)]MDK2594096.1 short chain dehydrogenase [Pseudoalteromonas sp. P94(2023)]
MKTAIVLGATGLIGQRVTQILAQQPVIEKVVAVTRRPIQYDSEKIVNEVVNFEKLNHYQHIFQGHMLFSCLGTTRKQAGSIAEQRRVDFDYQYQAASLAAYNQVAHYLLVSSSGANANSVSPYLKMKGELEQNIKQLGFKHLSIFQPSLLIGHRPDTRIAETIGNHLLPLICKLPGLQKYRPISGAQVATKMVSVAMSGPPPYETYRLDEIFKS